MRQFLHTRNDAEEDLRHILLPPNYRSEKKRDSNLTPHFKTAIKQVLSLAQEVKVGMEPTTILALANARSLFAL